MVVIVDGRCLRTVGSNSYMERIWGCGSQTMMVEIASAKMIHALCSDQTNILSKAQDYILYVLVHFSEYTEIFILILSRSSEFSKVF
jgi:hypothetical protein